MKTTETIPHFKFNHKDMVQIEEFDLIGEIIGCEYVYGGEGYVYTVYFKDKGSLSINEDRLNLIVKKSI